MEVIPKYGCDGDFGAGFLHECGGYSNSIDEEVTSFTFSPRMWRLFQKIVLLGKLDAVFSTNVEVIPITVSSESKAKRFLHECGGYSYHCTR